MAPSYDIPHDGFAFLWFIIPPIIVFLFYLLAIYAIDAMIKRKKKGSYSPIIAPYFE